MASRHVHDWNSLSNPKNSSKSRVVTLRVKHNSGWGLRFLSKLGLGFLGKLGLGFRSKLGLGFRGKLGLGFLGK